VPSLRDSRRILDHPGLTPWAIYVPPLRAGDLLLVDGLSIGLLSRNKETKNYCFGRAGTYLS